MSVLERHWYQPRVWLTLLLLPLEMLFTCLAALRRLAYRVGWLKCERLAVPVVVLGNIHVGGVGKTPLTIALLQVMQARGVAVGVISRGYGGRHQMPTAVHRDSDPEDVGDEPLLLASTGAPVYVGRDRVAAAQALLAAHPQIRLILADDGLQHYRLFRDLEVAVIDGRRGFGSARLLPNGPLREPISRLAQVDAVVINGAATQALPIPSQVARFTMTLAPDEIYALADPARRRKPADFVGLQNVALAGIGHPERFFATLRDLGIPLMRMLSFPDHYVFNQADIPEEVDAVIMTSKDAVKMRHVNRDKLWVLPVSAQIVPDLADWILARVESK